MLQQPGNFFNRELGRPDEGERVPIVLRKKRFYKSYAVWHSLGTQPSAKFRINLGVT